MSHILAQGLGSVLLVTQGYGSEGLSVTLREAVRGWLGSLSPLGSVVGPRIYFGQPSQLSAYPCCVVLVPKRSYGHNLAGADGTSVATIEISVLGLQESQAVAGINAVRDAADGFRGIQGLPIMSCLLDGEMDVQPVPPPDGSDQWIYQATVDYRIKHRVPVPASVTQMNV